MEWLISKWITNDNHRPLLVSLNSAVRFFRQSRYFKYRFRMTLYCFKETQNELRLFFCPINTNCIQLLWFTWNLTRHLKLARWIIESLRAADLPHHTRTTIPTLLTKQATPPSDSDALRWKIGTTNLWHWLRMSYSLITCEQEKHLTKICT
jgi:hypothetical protein